MRGFSRTLPARIVAALLAVLAASPLTAPFMTCDWSDLGHIRTDFVTHVSRHAVVSPDVKTPSDLNTTTFAVAVTAIGVADDTRRTVAPLPALPAHAAIRVLVLRL